MTDVSIVTPLLKKILQTMKQDERVSIRARPEFYVSFD